MERDVSNNVTGATGLRTGAAVGRGVNMKGARVVVAMLLLVIVLGRMKLKKEVAWVVTWIVALNDDGT
jgi:hypothetical protein